MTVEIVAIGDEIISGHTIDTNSAFIAVKLAEIGLPVEYKTAVGDNIRQMEEVISQALRRTDIVIATGGLGPTDDDVTKRAIVKVFKRNLVFHEDVLEDLKKRFAERGIEMPSINQNQALLPQGATYLANRTGSAIGIVIEENGKIFVSLPGVPREMKVMVTEELIPFLRKRIKQGYLKIIKLRTTGIMESALAEIIKPHIKIPDSIKFAYLPSYGGVDLRMIASGDSKEETDKTVEQLAAQLRELVGKYIFGENDDTLEAVVGKLLKDRKQTLATAESCTAGLLAGKITNVPGSSDYFDRGFVTYTNESKTEMLGVPEQTLIDHGAVSSQTAEAMAVGVKEKSRTDYGVAITGIAGPGGGTEEKPVGTVFIAVASNKEVVSKKFLMAKDREINRNRSIYAALEMLRRAILEIE